MKSFYRIMLGRQSVHAATCFAGDFIVLPSVDFYRYQISFKLVKA